jgi:prepilin-type processing-associated H-X9-DG protein
MNLYYRNRPQDTAIRIDGGMAYYWRNIGYSDKSIISGATYAPGQLNMAPQGIGSLLTAGYIGDASLYYCPSSDNMPGERPGEGATRLADWKAAGGFGGDILHYGDWRLNSYGGNQHRIHSHYFYRNIHCGIMNPWHSYNDDKQPIPGTKPRVNVRIGQPMFRNGKEIGGRALVADAFTKGNTYDMLGVNVSGLNALDISFSTQIAGSGLRAHRTAYNVLYGDGHVGVFGDPQQKVIWHTQGRATTTFVSSIYMFTANYFYGSGGWDSMGNSVSNNYFTHTPMAVWHEMDVSAGVDLP